jgi:hypothetical protein
MILLAVVVHLSCVRAPFSLKKFSVYKHKLAAVYILQNFSAPPPCNLGGKNISVSDPKHFGTDPDP